jgi:tRNA pseudouridine55 synthase
MALPDGFLLIDKPAGPTSYDMIRWIKRKAKDTKIGHAGTLDPLATGLLVVLLGRATKRQSDVMGRDKIYRCRLRLGLRTDTGDITGRVIETSDAPPPDAATLLSRLSRFLGEMEQVPPMYSALKKDGVPLYKLARAGKTVERASRRVTIHWMEPVSVDGADVVVRIKCSSGTYVRSLVEDIGAAVGLGATMVELVRESIGPLRLEDALPGGDIAGLDETALAERILPIDQVLH